MTQPPEQPRTAAGRALLEEVWAPRHRRYLPTNVARLTEAILAIERDMASEGASLLAHDSIEAAAPDPVASPPSERLRSAASRFLAAAQLESMTKAPEYIRAKRALRAALKELTDG